MARARRALAHSRRPRSPRWRSRVAQAQTYELVSSDVQATVRPDGSVAVDEAITVAFSGSFTYGFREIPLRSGERIDEIGVTESGRAFQPRLDCARARRAAGDVRDRGPRWADTRRLALHERWLRAADVRRPLPAQLARRRLHDVVDVNLKVWGDEWSESLGRLTSTMRGPGNVVRAGPSGLGARGRHDRGALRPAARARRRRRPVRRAAGALPRDAFTSDSGMKVEDGAGLDMLVADIRGRSMYERDRERIDEAKAHPVAHGADRAGDRHRSWPS